MNIGSKWWELHELEERAANPQVIVDAFDGYKFCYGPFPKYGGCYTKIPRQCANCIWRNTRTLERMFVGQVNASDEYGVWEDKPFDVHCVVHVCGGFVKG